MDLFLLFLKSEVPRYEIMVNICAGLYVRGYMCGAICAGLYVRGYMCGVTITAKHFCECYI